MTKVAMQIRTPLELVIESINILTFAAADSLCK